MDNCIVCCKSNVDVFSRITTVSREWKEWNIKRIIEKHLWWWYLRPPSNKQLEQWICRQCWQELSTFHNFYLKVEKENKEYYKLFNDTLKGDVEELTVLVDVNVDDEIYPQSLMELEKPKGGRKKKTIAPIKNNPIELPSIDIKSENDVLEISELCTTELNISNTLVKDEVNSTDWENSFVNYNDNSEDNSVELSDSDDNEDGNILNKGIKRKREAESTFEVLEQSYEFMADNQFVYSCSVCNAILDSFSDLQSHFRKEHKILGYAMCCNQKFYYHSRLLEHLNVHKDHNDFKCLQCNKSFSTRHDYEIHMDTHQLNEIRETSDVMEHDEFLAENKFVMSCSVCNTTLEKFCDLKNHFRKEHNSLGFAMCCNKKFYHRSLLVDHIKLHKDPNYFKCPHCNRKLSSRFRYESHIEIHQPRKPLETQESNDMELKTAEGNKYSDEFLTENQFELSCSVCNTVVDKFSDLKYHFRTEHNMKGYAMCCNKKFYFPSLLVDHINVHKDPNYFECLQCNKTFATKHSYELHMKNHQLNEIREIVFPLKEKKTKDRNTNITEVMKQSDEFIAENQFVLSCSICNTILDNFSDLKIHFRKEHNIKGYATCCNKKFFKRGVLVDHINVHKDPNYFKCLECNKSFSTRRSCELHMENHQLYETRETRFTCDICNKSFLKKRVFDCHLLQHVPDEERHFQCNLCDKKFASEHLRKIHFTLIHTRKYAKCCDICGKLYSKKSYFIKHMAKHNGEPKTKKMSNDMGSTTDEK